MTALKTRQRLRRKPSLKSDIVLPETELPAAESCGLTQFFEGLHIDEYIKY